MTTWNYEPYRGFLLNKRDANNQGPTYTYTGLICGHNDKVSDSGGP